MFSIGERISRCAHVVIDADSDPLVSFFSVRPLGLFLYFNVLYGAAHYIGQSLLEISITIPPESEPREELMTYVPISPSPIAPRVFNVWFNDSTSGGILKVYWRRLNTYPDTTAELNAVLRYDNCTQFCIGRGPFIVRNLLPGTHNFELFVDDFYGNSAHYSRIITIVGVEETPQILPQTPIMLAFPNPFNSSIELIIVGLMEKSIRDCSFGIFDLSGRLIAAKNIEFSQNGIFSFRWSPDADAPSGIYLARASFAGKYLEKKILLLR